MKKTVVAAGALLLAGLGLTFTSGVASAHTPSISADCSGVRLSAASFEPGRANTWTVTIGGATQSGTFEETFAQSFPVPQAGATTAWSARIASYDGAYDSGVQSGNVGPCGETDVCTDLPGNQPQGTECTPPPSAVRSDAGKTHGCDVAFNGREYGAGALTYDKVFEDGYVFNPSTNVWDLVTDTSGEVRNAQFTPWTGAQKVRAGCVEKQPADDHDHDKTPHSYTEVAKPPSHPVVRPPAPAAVPTVVDAGLVAATPREGSTSSTISPFVSPANALIAVGGVLILCAALARRRTSA